MGKRKKRRLKLGYLMITVFMMMLSSCFFKTEVKAANNEITLSVTNGEDITQKLQNAVNSYDKIVIPKGEYKCSGVRLNGLEGVTISAQDAIIMQNGTTNPLIYVSNNTMASNITIEGGTWDANQKDLPAFRFYGDVNNITITNLTVANSKNAGIRFKESENVIVENVTIIDNTGYALLFEAVKDVQVKGCLLKNSQCGIKFDSCVGQALVSSTKCIQNTDRAILVTGNKNITINDCELNENGEGLRISGVTGTINLGTSNVKNNKGMGIRIFDCTGNIAYSKIYAYDNGSHGVSMENCIGENDLYKVNSKRNGGEGISTSACNTIVLNKCIVTSNKDNGARIGHATTIWIKKGEYYKNGKAGIRFETVGQISVKGVSIHDNQSYGLNVDGLSVSGLVKEVQSYNNGNIGLRYKDSLGKINTQYSVVYGNSGSGIYGVNCENMVVNSVETYKNKGFGVNATDSSLANIKYCNVHDNEDIGIRYSNCNKIIVTDSHSYNNINAGIYADSCKTITFNMAEVKNNKGFGINVNNGTAVSTINSVAEGNTKAGLRYNNCKRVKVEDTKSNSNVDTGLYASAISEYIKIISTEANLNGEYGVNLNSIIGAATLNGVSASKNDNSGYFLNASNNIVLKKCKSVENGAHGIYILESVVEVKDMEVSKSYWCGLSATGTNAVVTIKGGQYVNNGTRPDEFEGDDQLCAGIGVYSGAIVNVTEAIVNENHGCGIAVAGAEDGSTISKVYVYSCQLNKNGDHGIGARPYGSIVVDVSESGQKNSICNNKNHGIMLNDYCTSEYIKNSIISENGKAGVSVADNSKAFLIQSSDIIKNAEDGIHVSSSSETVIKKCKIMQNGLAGIGVYSSSKVNISKNCEVSKNQSYGICVDNSNATSIDSSTIKENKAAGVVVRNSGKVESLKNCTITKNKTYGVYCGQAGNVTISKCIITSNTKDGVRATDKNSKVSFSDCEMSKNKQNGIVVTNNAVISKMKNIIVSENENHGIAIYKDSTVKTVTGKVTANNNLKNQIYVENGAKTTLTTQKKNYEKSF